MNVERDPVRSAIRLLQDALPSPYLAPRIKAGVRESERRTPSRNRWALGLVAVVTVISAGVWVGLRATQGPVTASELPVASATESLASRQPSVAPSQSAQASSAPHSEAPISQLLGTWTATRLPPIDGRTGHGMAWTGTEAVIWGGISSSSDPNHSVFDGITPRNGAAYDPASDRWRTIPNAPIPGRINPLMFWTGHEVLVFGGQIGEQWRLDGAAWNPVTNRWRTIARSPLTGSGGVGAWLDGRLYVVTSEATAAWDSTSEAWTKLPAAPIRPGWRTAAVAAGRLFVVAYGDGATPPVEWAVLDPPTGVWRHGQAPLEPLTAGVGFVGAGDRVVVTDIGDTFDPVAETWGTGALCAGASNGAVWTGSVILGITAAWDTRTEQCLQLPPAPSRQAPFDDTNGREFAAGVWTGTRYVTWSGGTGGDIVWVPKDGAVFTPANDLGPCCG